MLEQVPFEVIGKITVVLTAVVIVATIIFGILAILFRDHLKGVFKTIGKWFTVKSLLVIAILDLIAALDPSLLFVGIVMFPLVSTLVLVIEWVLRHNSKPEKFFPSLVFALIAGLVVSLPTPIAGILMAWFGTEGKFNKRRRC